MTIESVMPSSHLILCRPLLLLPPIPPSISVFSNESTLHMRWPKYWNFSFSISPSNEYSGLISFRTDWLDLLAVQGTLKSLLQHLSLLQRGLAPRSKGKARALRKGTPLASRVAQGVSGPSSSCVWNPRALPASPPTFWGCSGHSDQHPV